MTAPSFTSILWPFLAQVGWTVLLYAWLTLARWRAVRRGAADYGEFAFNRAEPREVARIRLNLANQFELPILFYAAIVLLVALGRVTLIDLVAAWVFVAGRIVHTLVQTLTDDVPLRGRVFLINFFAVTVLLMHVALLAWEGVGG
jgi:hypothetical protein